MEYGEGASQCRRADLVPVGQGGLRREPVTRPNAAGRDLASQVVSDDEAARRHELRHRLLVIRTATSRVRPFMVSSSPESNRSCFAPWGSWKRSLTRHARPPTWMMSPRRTVAAVISTLDANAPPGTQPLTASPPVAWNGPARSGRGRRTSRRSPAGRPAQEMPTLPCRLHECRSGMQSTGRRPPRFPKRGGVDVEASANTCQG